MWSTPLLPLLPGPLKLGLVVSMQFPFMIQMELFNHLLRIMIYLKPYNYVQIIDIT